MNLQSHITQLFQQQFGSPQVIAHAPGRVNLIGDHTDYNQGFVLPAAIDLGITMAVSKNGLRTCQLIAVDLNDSIQISLDESLKPVEKSWANYIIGVMAGLQAKGVVLEGFNAVFGGNIPVGSGLSSSAALECSTTYALAKLFSCKLNQDEVIRIAREAEHNFAGVKCGVMDQFASVMGSEGHAIQLDCRSLDYQYLPLSLGNAGLVLINTKVSHSLGDSQYNQRRKECEQGVAILQQAYPEVTSLRDVNLEMLETVKLPSVIYQRCRYVVEENLRVEKAAELLQAGQLKALGELMYQSHEGLSKLYQVSCDELDHLVTQASRLEAIWGSRMMGGGFGGCTINLIAQEYMEDTLSKLREFYMATFGIEPEIYPVKTANGARVLS
ncbi:galactokinase [Mongoliitalea lutea]|uniref:Galactokinase n=1 Tax=Mongoliitalea lutea TaxID=849756 RepID=A0A8J3D0K2_9BACT|nr:galactokinase [Mongoliitalea lutea]GHB46205.1 galactokinase [Mongoliitalea lutea]